MINIFAYKKVFPFSKVIRFFPTIKLQNYPVKLDQGQNITHSYSLFIINNKEKKLFFLSFQLFPLQVKVDIYPVSRVLIWHPGFWAI